MNENTFVPVRCLFDDRPVTVYSDDRRGIQILGNTLQRYECIGPEIAFIITGEGDKAAEELLRLKLVSCYRMYRNYRFEHDGLLDDILKIRSRNGRRAVYFYKKLVFTALSSIHVYGLSGEECRRALLELMTAEYRAVMGIKPSAKYMQAVKRLMECNIVNGDFEAAIRDKDNRTVIALWKMQGTTSRVQRTDKYVYDLFTQEEPGPAKKLPDDLLFYDPEFVDDADKVRLPLYDTMYYLDLADN